MFLVDCWKQHAILIYLYTNTTCIRIYENYIADWTEDTENSIANFIYLDISMKIYKNCNAGCSTKYNGNDILIFIYLGTTLTEYMKITMLFCFFAFFMVFIFVEPLIILKVLVFIVSKRQGERI